MPNQKHSTVLIIVLFLAVAVWWVATGQRFDHTLLLYAHVLSIVALFYYVWPHSVVQQAVIVVIAHAVEL